MFSDTLTINLEAPVVLNRVNQDKYSSEYLARTVENETRLIIRHTNFVAKKDRAGVVVDRHNVELLHTTFPSDTILVRKDMKMYFVLELERKPPAVDPAAFAQGLLAAFCGEDVAILTDSVEEGDGIVKLLNLES